MLYVYAVALRHAGRIAGALATLAELERHHPEYPRLYQERGHCHLALHASPAAIAAFDRAVTLNASLPASWSALQALYASSGQPARAHQAARHLAMLAALPAPIVSAFSSYADGEPADAERVVRDYLRVHGPHVEGMRLLARIGSDLEALDEAEGLLEGVLQLAPDYRAARYEYVHVLLKRHRHVRAREEIEALLAQEPGNRAYRITLAAVSIGLKEVTRALALYSELLAETPRDADLLVSAAHACHARGRHDDAVRGYRTAAAVQPGCGRAYWGLADMKSYEFGIVEIAAMQRHESAAVDAAERYHLCFALGKALEGAGRHEESFHYYARGNALKKSELRRAPDPFDGNAQAQRAVCTREFFAARRGVGCPTPGPIFIVGLPRAGSTLLEQILASHSAVEGCGELATMPRLVQRLKSAAAGRGYPDVLRSSSAADCRRLGAQYLAETLPYRQGKAFFVDKMPNNFRHLGLIHSLLPNARIVDARRGPMACCFGNFSQLFDSGHHFAYGLEDLGRYYRIYEDLMAHWDEALPGKVLRVQHEALVDDLEGGVRRLLEFCELPFEPACLEFHRSERLVETASAGQVRRPLDRAGIDRWRHYERWLGPLQKALGERVGG